MNIDINPDQYFQHEYNGTFNNERCIEVAFAKRYLEEVGFDNVIEIGAVLPYYDDTKHLVFDPFDKHPMAKSEFAENIDVKDKNILSISTIEHMGDAQGYGRHYRCQEPNKSYQFLDKLNSEAKSFFVTLPINQHLDLDKTLKENLYKFKWFGYTKKAQSPPVWELSLDKDDVFSKSYAYPFECANAAIFLYKGITCS